jgi:uncharacterized protein YbjT (DUF2867 family)
MTTANNRLVTVFGGTGFLGRRAVRHIRQHGFSVRIASRHESALTLPRPHSISARGEGELAVRAAFANATLVRPAVMFGPDDAFLTTLLKLLSQLPIYPMFGRGLTKLQPAYVEDVAEAIVRTLEQTDSTFEFGGPRVCSYEELIKVVAGAASLKPRLIPIPFAAWHVLAWFAQILPRPPITQNQVELMQIDTVASSELSGFKELGISPVAVEEILQEILWDH